MCGYHQESRLSPKPVSMAESQAGPTAPQLHLEGSGLRSALNGAVRAPLGDHPHRHLRCFEERVPFCNLSFLLCLSCGPSRPARPSRTARASWIQKPGQYYYHCTFLLLLWLGFLSISAMGCRGWHTF